MDKATREAGVNLGGIDSKTNKLIVSLSSRKERCFACGRKLGNNPYVAITSDEAQLVFVGSECYKNIGLQGWQPPKGGPKLYRGKFSPSGELLEVVRK